jgi:hypothetical protein
MNRRALCVLTLLTLLADTHWGCSEREKAPPPSEPEQPEETAPAFNCATSKGQVICADDWAFTCDAKATLKSSVNCRLTGEVCSAGLGCRKCVAGARSCGTSNNVVKCSADGRRSVEVEKCDAEQSLYCGAETASCLDLCENAIKSRSYIGCEYWAVPTMNSQLGAGIDAAGQADPFPFAVVIANPQAVAAQVTIEREGTTVVSKILNPGAVEAIELERIAELAAIPTSETDLPQAYPSGKIKEGAYRITASVPVTAYQFNPLQYRAGFGANTTYSHTNDASLLLPTGVLTGNYLIISRPSLLTSEVITLTSSCGGEGELPCSETTAFFSPGYFAVVGVEDAPTSIEVIVTAYTAPSATVADDGDVGELIPALAPGDVFTTTLNKGEVLQLVTAIPPDCHEDGDRDELPRCFTEQKTGKEVCAIIQYKYCIVGADYDLTGSSVKASEKVSVISGHNCDFIPYNRWACDHLEESLFPLETWGKEFFVSITKPVRDEPNIIRILSGFQANYLTFVPQVYKDTTLNKGEYLEFATDRHFQVKASGPISVAQFLVGQDYRGFGKAELGGKGDPSLTLSIPSEQWRTRYSFLAPNTFPDNYVNVIATHGQNVILDGEMVGDWSAIEGTEMDVSRIGIAGGPHSVESTYPFGIEVYGYASYTSYMYPGGLDLRVINLLL